MLLCPLSLCDIGVEIGVVCCLLLLFLGDLFVLRVNIVCFVVVCNVRVSCSLLLYVRCLILCCCFVLIVLFV